MSTAARRIRGQGTRHATALVHTSQHIDVHRSTANAIAVHLRRLAQRLADGDQGLLDELARQWNSECDRVPAADFGLTPVDWGDVRALLPTIAADAIVITDNSQSTERLSFDDADPRVIIAVGGNTLSRGLTL